MKRFAATLAIAMAMMLALAGCGGGGGNANLKTSVDGTYFSAKMPGEAKTETEEQSLGAGMSMKMTAYVYGTETESEELYAVIEIDWKTLIEQVKGMDTGDVNIKEQMTQMLTSSMGSENLSSESVTVDGIKGLSIDAAQAIASSGSTADLSNMKGDAVLLMTDQAAFRVVYLATEEKYSESTSKAFMDSFKGKDLTTEVMMGVE